MNLSRISHPENEPMLSIEPWQLKITEGNACAAAILGYFRLISIGILPTHVFTSWRCLEEGIMGFYGEKTIIPAIAYLVEIELLEKHKISGEKAVAVLSEKIPQKLRIGKQECSWCGSITITTHKHHYPIPKVKGGKDIVKICPNCHEEFHFLVDSIFYKPSQKLLDLFEHHPVPSRLTAQIGGAA